jgi:hypothetical protein
MDYTETPALCNTFWGSHGCDLPDGHKEPCECQHEGDEQEPGDIVKLIKLAPLYNNAFVTYDKSEYDGKHFGVTFYDEDNLTGEGYLTVWFSV